MRDRLPGPSRRAVLAGAAAGVAQAALPRPAGAAPAAPEVDVHCHTFCSADLPIVGFVAHQIPGLTEISRFVTRWPELGVRALLGAVTTLPNAVAPSGDAELAQLRALVRDPAGTLAPVPPLPPGAIDGLVASVSSHLPFAIGDAQRRIVCRALEALYLVAHPRGAIVATLAQTFPTVSLFTPALVDYDAWSDDRAPTPLWQQVLIQEQIARLSVAGRVGRPDARVHPFVAFDPRRQAEGPRADGTSAAPPPPGPASTALDLVRHAIGSAGFLGVKLYPPVGFAPLDNARLQPRLPFAAALDVALAGFYELCQAQEIPILTHASAANEYGLGLRALVAPARWLAALQRFPALRLDFGHFGHDYGVAQNGGVEDKRRGWIYDAAAIMDRYPNVYADLSNSPLVYDDAYAARLQALLADVIAAHPKVKRRLMYGSDWWLSALDPEAGRAVERFRSVLGAVLTPDELTDVMGRNALRFLGFLDDQNRPRPGAAARRLRSFYGSAPKPGWLPG